MNNYLVNSNNTENNKKAEKYIEKYINDLKLHFDFSNTYIIRALNKIISKLKKEEKEKQKKIIFFWQKKWGITPHFFYLYLFGY